MVCFCRNTVAQMQQALAQLQGAAPPGAGVAAATTPTATATAGVSAGLPGLPAAGTLGAGATTLPPLPPATAMAAQALRNIAAALAPAGPPAPPWQPNPSWQNLTLPTPALSPQAMATISALAQLRADALQQLGIDLLNPAQAQAFSRLAATALARLQQLAQAGVPPIINASAWASLAQTNAAATQVQQALGLGMLPSPAPPPPLAPWQPLLRQLQALAPLIAAAKQLGMDLAGNLAQQLASALRPLLQVPMPALPPTSQMLAGSMVGALAPISQLRQAFGVDPLAQGLAAMQQMVANHVQQVSAAVTAQTGQTPAALAALMQRLPTPVMSPATLAAPAVVAAAQQISPPALQALNWAVPPASALPVLSTGMPVMALTTQMQAALGISPAARPCGSGCDAAALTRGLGGGAPAAASV
jgi:hypothetical protein